MKYISLFEDFGSNPNLLKNTKVVDKDGKPLKVYHGTQSEFDTFNVPAWFTDNEKFAENFSADWGELGTRTSSSRVIEAYLTIVNPYLTDDWDVTERLSAYYDDLKKKGYDGVIFDDGIEREYIVFDQKQIKVIR